MVEVEGGVQEETQEFTWKLKNFDSVMVDKALVYSQYFRFRAGETIGLSSTWEVFLQTHEKDENKIGVYFRMVEKPASCKKGSVIAKCNFFIEGVPRGRIEPVNMADCKYANGYGFRQFVDKSTVAGMLVEGTLVIQVNFSIYSTPALPKANETVKELLEKFNKESSAKAWKDLEALLQLPIGYNEVKLVASDGKQFTAKKEVLLARSPVFKAMLVECDITEDGAEELDLPDVSSQTMEVIIHYLYTGKLLEEWKQVIIELTNAAAKYELKDLLAFLDKALGKVGEAKNAVELLALADKLKLKNAEADLVQLVRREGLGSKDALFQILRAEAPPQARDERPPGNNEGFLGLLSSLFSK